MGTRPGPGDGLLRLFGEAADVVSLEDPAYWDPADVRDYVLRVLLADQDPDVVTPYRGNPALATAVAETVASRAGSSFLVAQLTAWRLPAPTQR